MRALSVGVITLSFCVLGGCGADGRPPRSAAVCQSAPADRAIGAQRPGSAARAQRGAPSTPTAWSTPASIASAIDVNWHPALVFTGDGHAVATLGARGDASRVFVAKPGARAFRETRWLRRLRLLSEPVAYGPRGIAYVCAIKPPPRQHAKSGPLTRLGVALGTVAGSRARVQALAQIARRRAYVNTALAATVGGSVAAVWVEPRRGRSIVRIALREPAGRFGGPTTLSTGSDVTNIALAYGEDGDLVVAFARFNHPGARKGDIAVRVKRRGQGFGPVQSLGPSRRVSSIAVAASKAGGAVVAWGSQDGRVDFALEATTPWRVRAATLQPRASRFARAELLDPGDDVAPHVAGVAAAIAPDGTTTVLWSGSKRANRAPRYRGYTRPYPCPLRVATARPRQRFDAPQQLSANGQALGVISARDTTTTVLWGKLPEPESPPPDDYVASLQQIMATRRAPGADDFAAPQAVSARQYATPAAAIALDPRSQRPSALWFAAPDIAPDDAYDIFDVEALYSTHGT